eukprot:3417439-Amphidinium_carterae.1
MLRPSSRMRAPFPSQPPVSMAGTDALVLAAVCTKVAPISSTHKMKSVWKSLQMMHPSRRSALPSCSQALFSGAAWETAPSMGVA